MGDQLVYRLIDDNIEEADDYKRLLEGVGKRRLTIEIEPVRPRLADYASLLDDRRIGGLILDQRLSDYRPANYTGLELADYVRELNPELPLFILTNYFDAGLEAIGGSVEQIIPKGEVREHPNTYRARLLRRLGEYDQALTQQQKHLKGLIDKKLKHGLSKSEGIELDGIRAAIERPSAWSALDHEKQQESELLDQQKLLAQLQQAVALVEKAGAKKTPRPKKIGRSSSKRHKTPSKKR